MSNYNWPINPSSSGPVQFILDGDSTTVSENTGVPASSIPLPVKVLDGNGLVPDFATETTLAAINTKVATETTLAAINTKVATETTLASIDTKVPANLTVTATRLLVDGSGVTQPVSVASLPLPSGAATEATLSALNTKVVAVNTGAVVVSSSALPTGAATQTTLLAVSSVLGEKADTAETDSGATFATIASLIRGILYVFNDMVNTLIGNINLNIASIDASTQGILNKLPATLGAKTSGNSLAVVLASDQVAVPVNAQADVTATGSITVINANPNSGVATAGSTVSISSLSGQSTLSVQISGTWTGIKQVQGTVDGTNWVNLTTLSLAGVLSATGLPSATANIYTVNISGMAQVRVSANVATTGTAVVTLRATISPAMVGLDAPLPVGANIIGALTANQSTNMAQVAGVATATGNGISGTGVQRVTLASDSTGTLKIGGKGAANVPTRIDYSSSSVTTSTYVTLVASLSAATTEIEIFDSSGQTLVLATGAAAAEVNQIFILPGGNGRVPLAIAAGTRLSIKAISANATVGEISVNFYT